jgi:hypothetical protein
MGRALEARVKPKDIEIKKKKKKMLQEITGILKYLLLKF